jgi:hypothetical protein
MRAAVMRGHHLHVLDVSPAVRPLALDAEIREPNAAVHHWQLVLLSPALNLLRRAIRTTVTVTPVPVSLLKERLVLTLELVIEHDTVDARPLFVKTLCRAEVRAIELRVVRQFTSLDHVRVKRLVGLVIGLSMPFEKVTPASRERDKRRALPVWPIQRCDCPNQSGSSKTIQITVPQIARSTSLIAQIVHWYNSECTDHGQRPDFGSAEFEVVLMNVYALALGAVRQFEFFCENVAWIEVFSVSRIRRLTVSGFERTRVQAVPHTSYLSRRIQVFTEVLVDAVGSSKLLVDVRQFAAGIAKEQPTCDGVIDRTKVKEDQQRANSNREPVTAKERSLVWREEAQFAC